MTTAKIVEASVGTSFRSTMRRFPATVTIVTANDGERDHGMTVTAVTSVSMDPPSLLVCINGQTLLHEMLHRVPHFAVNVLCDGQAELSDAFAGKVEPEYRFAAGKWRRNEAGMMVLEKAHANVVCRRVAAVPFGTHTTFIGEVISAEVSETSRPLIYENAQYCVSRPAAVAA